LDPGDLLAMSSDGVTEAQDAAEEEFGDERFLLSLEKGRQLGCHDAVERVFADVQEFASGVPQHDDITLMVVKRDP